MLLVKDTQDGFTSLLSGELHWGTWAVPKQVWQQLTEQVCLFATVHSTAIRGFWLPVVQPPYFVAFSSCTAGGGKA